MNQLFFRVKQRQLGSRVSVPDLCCLMVVQTLAGEIDGSQCRKALALIDGFIVAGLLKVQPAEVRREQSRCQYQSRDKIDGVWTDWTTRTLAMGCLPDFDDVWTRPLMVDIPDPEGPTVDAEDVADLLAVWRSEIEADVNLGPLLALWLEQHGHSLREVAEAGGVKGKAIPDDLVKHSDLTGGLFVKACRLHSDTSPVSRKMVETWTKRATIKKQAGNGELYSLTLINEMLAVAEPGYYVRPDRVKVTLGAGETIQHAA